MTPVSKPWAGAAGDFRLFRTPEPLPHGISDRPVGQAMPTADIVTVVVITPDDATLQSGHVAHRVASVVAEEGGEEWLAVDHAVMDAMEALAAAHGLSSRHHHHVATAHTGRPHAVADHIAENLFAEYLLTGSVSLHHAGGAIKVEDGHRRYTAYEQPGEAEKVKYALRQFLIAFGQAARNVVRSLEGKVVVG